MNEPDVIVRLEGAVGRLTLNRPKALHGLTGAMCGEIIGALLAWRDDPGVHSVLIDHAGDRGFCAGADVKAVAADADYARAFFRLEYQMNVLLFRYPKPVVAAMDGIVMGGGVGLSMPARFRIATERTLWAMPEGAIGLFPDVGAGWRLPRLPGSVGPWLALTGARLGPADCLLLGLATDYVHASRLADLKADLLVDPERFEERLTEVEDDPGEPPVALERDRIDRCFGHPTIEAVFEALKAEGGPWAEAQLAALADASPTTLKVAMRQLRIGAQLERFEDEMAMELRLASRLAVSHDFREGVRARLIDRSGPPAWKPDRLEAVGADLLDALFAPLPDDEEFRPVG